MTGARQAPEQERRSGQGRRLSLFATIALAGALGPAASIALSRAGATAASAALPHPTTTTAITITTTPTTTTTRPTTTQPRTHPPEITPQRGKPYVPALGDWEGTVNAYPASFSLLSEPGFARRFGSPAYGYQDLVLLVPDKCPPSASNYLENLLTVGQPSPVRRHGSFGLTHGFEGGLAGARSASLAARYHVSSGGCQGKLTWHMRPAKRRVVQDGTWRVQFSDGESGKFKVIAGGRVAASITLPTELKPCGGPFGAIDLFIGPSGTVNVTQPSLRVSASFSRARATGQLSIIGGTCSDKRFPLSAKLQRPGT